LRALAQRHPTVRPLLWRTDGQPNPVLVCFVNGRQLPSAGAPATPLRDGDELLLISAVEGG
jgi:sulfur carrier protein ThiS